jgi:hypothetical protein
MKVIGIPTIVPMNIMEVGHSPYICRSLKICRGIPGGVLVSCNAIGNFLLWWHKWKTLIVLHRFHIWHITRAMHLTLRVFVSTWISILLRMGLVIV